MVKKRETTEVDPKDYPKQKKEEDEKGGKRLAGLSLLALGVVYGDIGTSPLYALRECFYGTHAVPLNEINVLGVLSLIFWALIIVISIKYLALVLRADNQGEGGILALLALVGPKRTPKSRVHRGILLLGLFGTALLYGDMMITPAISVLSAVEGLEVAAPELGHWVVPSTVVILLLLFLFQHRGTEMVGRFFGPVMLVWFLCLALMGLVQIWAAPAVLAALWPGHAVTFFVANGLSGFLILGAVFLVVTGGEALYADLGHFGRRPIRWAWFGLVLPALLSNYFGQGALLLQQPEAVHQPFYHLAPTWARYPLLGLATLATVIASQAVISGAYSITRQAMRLGDLPPMGILQTSRKEQGQIYVPAVNWLLFIACVGLTVGFGTSSALAAAYGVAVSTTMVITTVLAFVVARQRARWKFWQAALLLLIFLTIDLSFWGANIVKVPQGGWFPIVVAALMFAVMSTWRRGSQLLEQRLHSRKMSLETFARNLDGRKTHRTAGTDVFLSDTWQGTPLFLLHHIRQSKVLARQVLVLTILTKDVPTVPRRERYETQSYEKGIYRVGLHYGFSQNINIPSALAGLKEEGIKIDLDDTTYYIGHRILIEDKQARRMPAWQEKLFAFMARNNVPPTRFFNIPDGQVVELGVRVPL